MGGRECQNISNIAWRHLWTTPKHIPFYLSDKFSYLNIVVFIWLKIEFERILSIKRSSLGYEEEFGILQSKVWWWPPSECKNNSDRTTPKFLFLSFFDEKMIPGIIIRSILVKKKSWLNPNKTRPRKYSKVEFSNIFCKDEIQLEFFCCFEINIEG
jgi:hypothetical protein